jgi:hypothetical protein
MLFLLCATSACSLLLPSPSLDTASPARWELDPEEMPGPADTTFVAFVQEIGCASGRAIEGKLLPPVVEYGEDEIVVRLYLEPPEGDAHECPLPPPTRFEIQLREPIGNRRLVDGSGSQPPGG